MDYRRLGESGLQVSRLGIGCMSYGSPAWRPWVLDDTADMYSLGVSEEVTGPPYQPHPVKGFTV